MTFYKRELLEKFGARIEDAGQKAAFDTVMAEHTFSSDKPHATTFEGQFNRALVQAGLEEIREKLTLSYHRLIIEAAGDDHVA